jgi:hypothetical protein
VITDTINRFLLLTKIAHNLYGTLLGITKSGNSNGNTDGSNSDDNSKATNMDEGSPEMNIGHWLCTIDDESEELLSTSLNDYEMSSENFVDWLIGDNTAMVPVIDPSQSGIPINISADIHDGGKMENKSQSLITHYPTGMKCCKMYESVNFVDLLIGDNEAVPITVSGNCIDIGSDNKEDWCKKESERESISSHTLSGRKRSKIFKSCTPRHINFESFGDYDFQEDMYIHDSEAIGDKDLQEDTYIHDSEAIGDKQDLQADRYVHDSEAIGDEDLQEDTYVHEATIRDMETTLTFSDNGKVTFQGNYLVERPVIIDASSLNSGDPFCVRQKHDVMLNQH